MSYRRPQGGPGVWLGTSTLNARGRRFRVAGDRPWSEPSRGELRARDSVRATALMDATTVTDACLGNRRGGMTALIQKGDWRGIRVDQKHARSRSAASTERRSVLLGRTGDLRPLDWYGEMVTPVLLFSERPQDLPDRERLAMRFRQFRQTG